MAFKQIWLPKSVMLDKYVCIENDQYVQKVKGIRNMEVRTDRLELLYILFLPCASLVSDVR